MALRQVVVLLFYIPPTVCGCLRLFLVFYALLGVLSSFTICPWSQNMTLKSKVKVKLTKITSVRPLLCTNGDLTHLKLGLEHAVGNLGVWRAWERS